MKNFLANKHNVALSAYITDKNPYASPAQITTNGALTIIDNSDPSNHIEGLVPNSQSIFLDNLFLASGYGFSSYEYFESASYIINTYEGVITYIEDEINELRNKTFNLEYSYDVENKIDHVYNTYGWLKEYKKLNVKRTNTYTYLISLNTIYTPYINNIQLELREGKKINGQINQTNTYTDLTYNYFNINSKPTVQISLFINNDTSINDEDNTLTIKEKIKMNGPDLYINNEFVDLNKFNESGNLLTYTINPENINSNYNTQNLSLVCKNGDDIVYSYMFNDLIKWRYEMLPFNTEMINILSQLNIESILTFDNYEFSDNDFVLPNNIKNEILLFVHNNENNMVYLDDNTEIEFSGTGYKSNNSIFFTHDYILIKYNSIKIDFYFNNIKNNNWNYIELEDDNEDIYRLYQSPKRYIGKHKWIIKYNYE